MSRFKIAFHSGVFAVAGGFIFVAASSAQTNTLVVTAASDSGAGSLREAVSNAKTADAGTRIVFHEAITYIPLETPLRLDGPSPIAIEGQGRVTLTGAAENKGSGLSISSPNTTLTGLTLQGFDVHGVNVESTADGLTVDSCVIAGNGVDGIFLGGHFDDPVESVTIRACTIGVMPDGTPAPNGSDGIDAEFMANSTIGEAGAGNVIAAMADPLAVAAVRLSEPDNVIMEDNFVGTDPTGTTAIADDTGIVIRNASNVIIRGNLIAGWSNDAIRAFVNDAVVRTGPVVQNNILGQAADGSPLPNVNGITLRDLDGALVGGANAAEGNVIAHCTGNAILVDGSRLVTMRHNLIFNNAVDISLINGANGDIARPEIAGVDPVAGSAPANSLVDLYTGNGGAEVFVETVQASASGNFTATAFKGITQVRAQATDPAGNSSALSEPAEVDADTGGCASSALRTEGNLGHGDAWILLGLVIGLLFAHPFGRQPTIRRVRIGS